MQVPLAVLEPRGVQVAVKHMFSDDQLSPVPPHLCVPPTLLSRQRGIDVCGSELK